MKKLLLILALLALPATAFAAPVSWDYTTNLLQPLQSGWNALVKASRFQATSTTASIFPYASTTGVTASYASSTKYYGADLATCQSGNFLTWAAGKFGCDVDQTGAGGNSFAYPFPSNATTTSISFNGGLTGVLTGSLVGNADTATALAANGANCSAGNAPLGVNASGAVESCFDVWTQAENTSAAYISSIVVDSPLSGSGTSASHLTISTAGTWSGNAGTATALAANGTNASAGNAILGVDASGNAEGAFDVWTEAENTAAAYAAQATTIAVNGTANQITSSAGAQSLASNRTWTLSIPSQFNIQNASTTNFSANTLAVGGTATTSISAAGTLKIQSLSGVLIGSSGTVSVGSDGTDYTLINASTCTNQLFSAVTAAGVFTCSTVSNAMLANSTISGIALGGTLGALTATNSTLTFSGSYDGSTARTVGLNLANANTWSALQQFALASSTQLSAASETFYIDSAGRVQAKDTTNAWSGVVSPTRYFVLETATTTTWTATTSAAYVPYLTMPFTGVLRDARCTASSTASFLGVAPRIAGVKTTPSYFVASTTVGQVKFTANNTFTTGQRIDMYVGTTTTDANALRMSCTFGATETY